MRQPRVEVLLSTAATSSQVPTGGGTSRSRAASIAAPAASPGSPTRPGCARRWRRRRERAGSAHGFGPDVAAALEAADIPASKLGSARGGRLGRAERELYLWILREFATSGRPTRAALVGEAERLGGDHDAMLASLAREDLVHLGSDGEVAVAYPFSGRATAHRVRFAAGHDVDAMCAIDALGIAPMFDEPLVIDSRDPVTDERIRVRLEPNGDGSWEPESAVVVAGASVHSGDACFGCCPVLNVFASSENAKRWLERHPEIQGHVISITTAIAAGRAIFGEVLGGR